MPAILLSPVLIVALVANGLLAGLFFVFTAAISPGFHRVDDGTYIRAFRAINSAILNGRFLAVFFAAPIAALASVVLHVLRGSSAATLAVAAGTVCSVLTFGITAAGNVPLNSALARAEVRSDAQRRAARQRFERPWNSRNLARTVSSTGALILFATALASD
ncbi:anthrone oxygenase family protein [Leucobacter komagatae]|uniref:Membrane protein n=1 Tax=Leucobacter komagatae TaxID=55969 RepID=A0A0D0HVM1_9MICO|nr:anthrone oxygenase family protein [Leucobacter komagatae]KIP51651.1 membrane protein [Leucobacter komagatae]